MFPRTSSDRILKAASTFPCVVVTGARQVGKTTLLKSLFPQHHYVSLDTHSIAEQAELSPEVFLAKYPAPLIIDEVQYAPSLFRSLKIAIDANRHAHGQYLLTGSQKFTLMKGVTESLAGRSAFIELEGLSAEELAPVIQRPAGPLETQRVVGRGSFPELWRQPGLERDEFLRSYISTYLERDVRQILNVVHLRNFERFLRACAIRSGNLLNKSELARDVGISPATANEWLSILEASNQIVLLEPWFGNLTKRLAKSPKLYLADSGMLAYFLAQSEADWLTHPFSGAIWETFLFAELRKALQKTGKASSLWFYRDAQGREVDFLIESGAGLLLIEAKAREILRASDLAALDTVASILGEAPIFRGRAVRKIVCGFPLEEHKLREDAWAVPGLDLGRYLTSD